MFKVQFFSLIQGSEETFKVNAGIDSAGGIANIQLGNAKKVEGNFILTGCVHLVSDQKSAEDNEGKCTLSLKTGPTNLSGLCHTFKPSSNQTCLLEQQILGMLNTLT